MESFVSPESENMLNDHIQHLNDKGYNIPTSVGEIKNFPYENFIFFKKDAESLEVILLRFGYEYIPDVARILWPSPMWTINLMITYLMPIISIILGFTISGWFFAGVLLFFISLSRSKNFYNWVIFKSAYDNELAFCFLFYTGQVSVSNQQRTYQVYYDREKSSAEKS